MVNENPTTPTTTPTPSEDGLVHELRADLWNESTAATAFREWYAAKRVTPTDTRCVQEIQLMCRAHLNLSLTWEAAAVLLVFEKKRRLSTEELPVNVCAGPTEPERSALEQARRDVEEWRGYVKNAEDNARAANDDLQLCRLRLIAASAHLRAEEKEEEIHGEPSEGC